LQEGRSGEGVRLTSPTVPVTGEASIAEDDNRAWAGVLLDPDTDVVEGGPVADELDLLIDII